MKVIKISDKAYEYLSQEKGNYSFAHILDKLLFDEGEMEEVAYKSEVLGEDEIERIVEEKIEELRRR